MALQMYNHESCDISSKIGSVYCTEMSTALNIQYTQYAIPSSIMLTSDIRRVYLAVANDSTFDLIPVDNSDITLQAGNKITLLNQNADNLQLHNRLIVVPINAFNLCFTGVANTNVSNKRPIWLKCSDTTKLYDYLYVTSIDYFANYYTILEYPNVSFLNGVGSNFTNLTSLHEGMKVDFDGQYVGGIVSVNGVSSLTLDTNYTSIGTSRAFVYAQSTLEFALDIDGVPGSWYRWLSLPAIDTTIPYKFWVRDFKTVSNDITVYANNAIRILGTEFLL